MDKYRLQNLEEYFLLKAKYNFPDDIINRLIGLRSKINIEKDVILSYEELIRFLNISMNSNDMQIWLIRKEFEGESLTLSQKLKKYFELTEDEKILMSYDIYKNQNEKNIEDARKMIKRIAKK